jgi:hypothetical protein
MKTTHILIKQHFFHIISLVVVSCLLSCQEFVEVDTPNYLLSGENVFTDKQTVEAAMIGIYGQLRSNLLLTGGSKGMSNLLGNYADEIDFYGDIGLAEEVFYKNNLLASNATVAEIWNGCYNQIYATNAIIEGVAGSAYFSDEEIRQYSGEAKFLRALIHFYLFNLYGDVPYITTTNYIENQSVKRDDRETVYTNLISDLIYAKENLPDADTSGEHVRANARTARALLARVYLYNKEWSQAEAMASSVIVDSQWETNLENVFLKESPSILLQLMPEFEGMNTLEAETFIFETAPPPTRALSNGLINSFETGDLRKTMWIGEVSDGNQSYYYPYKYKHRSGEGGNAEYSVILRLAEQFLIRAEARARMGDIAGAQADLNRIRNRAGLANTSATSENELLAAILQERRVELFTEHGHRFFDLKRTENLDVFLVPIKLGWNSTDGLFPLPEKELLTNPNLQPQNPGY